MLTVDHASYIHTHNTCTPTQISLIWHLHHSDGTFGPYNSAKAVVHLYPHSDTGLSARKSSAVNLGTLKIGDASLYYLEQGIPGLELMMLHCVARSSSDRVVFGQIHESSHPLDISPDRSSLLASAWTNLSTTQGCRALWPTICRVWLYQVQRDVYQ